MAFLFKSKKNADKAQAAKDGGVGSAASLQMSNGATRGGIGGEKGGPVQQSSTPTGSVNNSITSLQGGGNTGTPSPDQLNGGRRGPSVDQPSEVSCFF